MRLSATGLSLLLMGWMCALSGGCSGPQVSSKKVVAAPVNNLQQQMLVLEVVPLKTSRTECERRLEAAGVKTNPSISQSVLYCDQWLRKDGSRWQLDVALLFDENGLLYTTRQASAETTYAGALNSSKKSEKSDSRTASAARTETTSGKNSARSTRDEPDTRGPVVGSPFKNSDSSTR